MSSQPTPINRTMSIGASVPPVPSDAARMARRLVFQVLEDGYDDVAKGYRAGFSDERVAKETGASLQFVKQIRESDFDPVSAPSEFAKLEADLKAARAVVEAIATEMERLRKLRGWG